MTTNSALAAGRPKASPPSSSGSTPSSSTSIRRPATERTVCSERRSVRSTRSSGIANGLAADVDLQRGDDRQRQRQADLGERALAGLGVEQRPRRRARGSWSRTTSMPTPRPEMSLVVSAVEKPGANSSSTAALHVDRRRPPGRRSDRRSTALRATACGVDAAAVVADLDDDAAAGVAGGDLERAGRRLAGRDALLGGLQAVVERVADEVHERVAERVDDGAVQFGVGADEVELDLLAELGSTGRGPGAGSAGRRRRRGSSGPA